MEEKARSYRINWLPAVLFAVLPLIQLIRFIMLQLAYPDAWLPTFTGYLNILWAAAYILLAIALFSGKRNTLPAFLPYWLRGFGLWIPLLKCRPILHSLSAASAALG